MLSRLIGKRIVGWKKSVLLLGPRQVGKSTLCRSLNPLLTINLADEDVFLRHAREPALLKREVHALSKPGFILIDEVQRLPPLLNTVQSLMDEGLSRRFLLTGSSARKLKGGGANLLPGRVIVETLDPLSYWEMGRSFDLERCLRLGGLPGVYLDREGGEQTLASYAATYLREEIQAEALVRNIGGYARFLDTAAGASGSWINYSKVASDAEIPKETVRRFYRILEDTLLVFRLPPFSPGAASRRISQRDRYVFFDLGVRNALIGAHLSLPGPVERGMLFEQWCILQCLYFIRSAKLPWKPWSYRTDTGLEVDLVLERDRDFLCIECKWGRQIAPADLRGLQSFSALARKPVRKAVVYRGESLQRFPDGTSVYPVNAFLDALAEGAL